MQLIQWSCRSRGVPLAGQTLRCPRAWVLSSLGCLDAQQTYETAASNKYKCNPVMQKLFLVQKNYHVTVARSAFTQAKARQASGECKGEGVHK